MKYLGIVLLSLTLPCLSCFVGVCVGTVGGEGFRVGHWKRNQPDRHSRISVLLTDRL